MQNLATRSQGWSHPFLARDHLIVPFRRCQSNLRGHSTANDSDPIFDKRACMLTANSHGKEP